MRYLAILASLVSTTFAFPNIINDPALLKSASGLLRRQQDALGISQAQTNCGPTPCLTFDGEDQLVTITGDHAYASPGAGDIRGPCPGLNAAANHGFLPRNG